MVLVSRLPALVLWPTTSDGVPGVEGIARRTNSRSPSITVDVTPGARLGSSLNATVTFCPSPGRLVRGEHAAPPTSQASLNAQPLASRLWAPPIASLTIAPVRLANVQ